MHDAKKDAIDLEIFLPITWWVDSCGLGFPGTGKSFLLQKLVQLLSQQRGKDAIGVCAATGVAGIHIRGSTVHSFLGCGKAENDQDSAGFIGNDNYMCRRDFYRVEYVWVF